MHLYPQEKLALKAQKDAAEAKYKVAYVDSKAEQVSTSVLNSNQAACIPALQSTHGA